jgi:hypothetical protein
MAKAAAANNAPFCDGRLVLFKHLGCRGKRLDVPELS